MPGIGIITNPHSKSNKRNPEAAELLGYVLGEHGQLAATRTLSELSDVALRFRDANISVLAINGGDGTICKTITAFLRAYQDKPLPKIALLRGGTMNVLAQNLGIHGSSPNILFRLCESYARGVELPIKTIRCLRVNGSYGFIYADGACYNMLKEFYQSKSNALGAALLIVKIGVSGIFDKELFRRVVHSQAVAIQDDIRHIHLDSLAIMVSSIVQIPYGIRLFPDTDPANKGFQYLGVRCSPKELLRRVLPLVLLNRAKDYESKIGGISQNLSLKASPGYNYSLDGEMFTAADGLVNLTMGPPIDFVVI